MLKRVDDNLKNADILYNQHSCRQHEPMALYYRQMHILLHSCSVKNDINLLLFDLIPLFMLPSFLFVRQPNNTKHLWIHTT